MPSLTIKNIPDPLLERLRFRASRDRRSINQEVLYLLERALMAPDDTYPTYAEAQAQARTWSRLAGRWVSDRPAEEEIREIYAARTGGREVDL